MRRGRIEEFLKRNFVWFACFVVVAWIYAAYRYSIASFNPVPEQGLVVPIDTKYGVRYISELDRWIFDLSALGIIFFVVWKLFQNFFRSK